MSNTEHRGVSHHIPILLKPIIDFLAEGLKMLGPHAKPGVVIDCTLGGGGHTSALLQALIEQGTLGPHCVIGIDQDPDAINRNQAKFKESIRLGQMELFHGSFAEAELAAKGRPIYGILADLGISSDQIDSEHRGFSFRFKAPLDMRMNTTVGVPLQEWLERVSESELAEVIFKYSEERNSRKIARKLVDLRSKGQLPTDTEMLAEVISSTFPPKERYKGFHPATRSFQAFRIEINGELKALESLISNVFPKVEPGGRIAVLSFHSLEDRLVKEAFRVKEMYELPFKKPMVADENEIALNSRSRSAKLRLAIKK